MLSAVNFNHKTSFIAQKVGDVFAKWELVCETYASGQLAAAYMAPQGLLGFC